MTKNLRKITLLIGDIILLYFSLWLALLIRFLEKPAADFYQLHIFPFTLVFILWLIVFYIDGWYELKPINRQQFFAKIFRDTFFNALIAVTVFYFLIYRFTDLRPQTILLLAIVLFLVLFVIWRMSFGKFIRYRKILIRILFVGKTDAAKELAQEISSHPDFGYEVVGFFDPSNEQNQNLYQNVKDNKINTLITAVDPDDNPNLAKALFSCLALKVNFFNLASFYENITGKIPVTTIKHTWFLENLTEGGKKSYDLSKRLVDLILAVIGLIITSSLWLMIAVIIKIESKGPAIYKQQRVGQESNNFTLIKFRSMIHNAENNGAVWAQKNDKRVTRFGNFLRRTRLDELPQFINIIKGEMSFIGPRPERPKFVEELSVQIPFYKERLLVKPGLTGWAQTMGPAYGGSKEESLQKLQYDLFYIKNRSLTLDLSILLKTIKIVLSRQGV